jgi:alpha-ketoglutarate-dependent taurine dioxygenase
MNPFDLADFDAYERWRDWKLAHQPRDVESLVVEVRDPRELRSAERVAIIESIARCGFALYRSRVLDDDSTLPRRLGAQLGMNKLDANWLAQEDGVSRITVSDASDEHGGFIPYTNRAIGWHTDGYYHPEDRRILGMVLHCVRPAMRGGENALLDHELAYIALRERARHLVQALMQPDAMTIPERTDESGVARAAQTGPVFFTDEHGQLHMRYTARTRSIEWKADDATREAASQLQDILKSSPHVWRLRMEAGMGLVGRNILHDRAGFDDDPRQPRLMLRARFADTVRITEAAWRSG